MGSRGGGFLSLVVANGAIYNRIVIPGKTRLLTPRQGDQAGRGDLPQPPLPLPAGEGAIGAELEGSSRPELLSAQLEGPAEPLLLPPKPQPLPCFALLCVALLCFAFLPPGSSCWPRTPELLPLRAGWQEAAAQGAMAGDGVSLLVALPGWARMVPCASPALRWLPGARALQKGFWR